MADTGHDIDAALAAFAREWGIDETKRAAKRLRKRTRPGRPRVDDTARVQAMARLVRGGASINAAARQVARENPGHSEEATYHRVRRITAADLARVNGGVNWAQIRAIGRTCEAALKNLELFASRFRLLRENSPKSGQFLSTRPTFEQNLPKTG